MSESFVQPIKASALAPAPCVQSDLILGAVAHELRAPLSAVRLAAQLMSERGSLSTAVSGHLRVIERQVDHMTRLIGDLFELGRAAQGQFRLRRQWSPLSEILQTAFETIQATLLGKQQRFRMRCEEDNYLLCDRGRIIQVMTNLFVNAARYTPERGEIHVEAVRQERVVLIRVVDSGIGIAPHALPELLHSTPKWPREPAAGGGMGIGLLLARVFVQLHEGTLDAESAGVGCGSCFTVRLPVGAGDVAHTDPTEEATGVEASAATIAACSALNALRSVVCVPTPVAHGRTVITGIEGLHSNYPY